MLALDDVRSPFDVDVLVRGPVSEPDIGYARTRLAAVVRTIGEPVPHAKLKLSRVTDPAVRRPLVCEGTLEVNGHVVRAQAAGRTVSEAIGPMVDRLRAAVDRLRWRAAGPYPFPADRPVLTLSRGEQRRLVRHKWHRLAVRTVDEAAFEMSLLDFDFHLFIEEGSGQDCVLYRSGPTRYRLAQLRPEPHRRWDTAVPLSVSHHPASHLTLRQAIERLAATGSPFVFFADVYDHRGRVLYRRHDGHYGLIRAT
jgi:hypothetical protein